MSLIPDWKEGAERLLKDRDRFTQEAIKEEFAKDPEKGAILFDEPNNKFLTPVFDSRYSVIWFKDEVSSTARPSLRPWFRCRIPTIPRASRNTCNARFFLSPKDLSSCSKRDRGLPRDCKRLTADRPDGDAIEPIREAFRASPDGARRRADSHRGDGADPWAPVDPVAQLHADLRRDVHTLF